MNNTQITNAILTPYKEWRVTAWCIFLYAVGAIIVTLTSGAGLGLQIFGVDLGEIGMIFLPLVGFSLAAIFEISALGYLSQATKDIANDKPVSAFTFGSSLRRGLRMGIIFFGYTMILTAILYLFGTVGWYLAFLLGAIYVVFGPALFLIMTHEETLASAFSFSKIIKITFTDAYLLSLVFAVVGTVVYSLIQFGITIIMGILFNALMGDSANGVFVFPFFAVVLALVYSVCIMLAIMTAIGLFAHVSVPPVTASVRKGK